MILRKSICIFVAVMSILGMWACKERNNSQQATTQYPNQIAYAEGFELYEYESFKLLKIKKTHSESDEVQTYVLYKKGVQLPDSLEQFSKIQIPIQSIVVTSTTHLPSLESLGVEKSLIGFPNLNYVSSEAIRKRIDAQQIQDVGQNQILDIEKVIELNPQLFVDVSISGDNPYLQTIAHAGIPVIINSDWTEKTPLGRAEWIKFFGALYDKSELAQQQFQYTTNRYKQIQQLVATATNKPKVLTGNIFEDVWYLPKGNSWNATFFEQAHVYYPWSDTQGVGSLALSFEEVYDKAHDADFWILTGTFDSLEQMQKANHHYTKFEAFGNKKVFSANKKGVTGGLLYFELAPNRPDLVLTDLVKIFHPELLPEHQLYFFEPLQ